MTQPSPVIQLLNLVWSQTNTATGHSWERLNHAMQEALGLAIGAGFPFARDDMTYIAEHYRFGYWCTASPEWIYTTAVVGTNLSAAQSYEAWQQRPPFIMDNVQCAQVFRNPYRHVQPTRRKRDRLTVDARFTWYGQQVTVTSFAADGRSLTACSYKPQPKDSSETVIEKRFQITQAELQAERKARKERTTLRAVLTTVAHEHKNADTILAALGITTMAEFDCLPLTTLRQVAQQFAATPHAEASVTPQ